MEPIPDLWCTGSEDEGVEGRPLDNGSLVDLESTERARRGDLELVERARGGDLDAYDEIVHRYQGIAHRVAYLITRDPGEAEDAVQEAFVKAHRALGRFRKGASFRPWLLTIVGNEARNRVRSAGRRAGLVLRAGMAGEGLAGAAPSAEALALREEQRRVLLVALERLGEDDRLVISYRYLLDMSEADMAAALGVARGTVKSRLSRAMARLRDTVDESALKGGVA